MTDILVLVLVFAATTWGVWVVTPLLAQIGLERSATQHIRSDGVKQLGPIYRFTTPERLAQACWSAALLGAGLAAAALIAFNVLSPMLIGGACLLAGVIAFHIPAKWVQHRIRTRQRLFDARLTDLTLGLANGLRAGAALPQSLEIVSRDMGGPMTEELMLVLQEYRLGMDLPEALSRLCERMPGEDLSLLVTAIRLTMQSGGSLAEVLDRITDTIRQRTEFKDRLLTMTAQGRFEAIAMAAAPLVAFLILFFLDRELMQPLLQTKIGWCAIGAVVILETVGFLVINKIVTIDV
ncbi:MAG TPA: type II secretion system F family protein [Kiritimatiellia bacterium]|jgi:tight adherence protein B|nr:type II secretion system F family protein [Kiritimatiellia bacterium]HOR97175.1 type II secretion system F family protein [Kiritimatiellia bacterium]HPC49554.1 type II secretion system F family protein [Kiritimatiellia bacterium]HPK36693.1 type II secretion system F family protein [Kiritimatiellia bacterium]HPW74560.1 type II secretion system F family protein [Kiritimatiellia bacterium]